MGCTLLGKIHRLAVDDDLLQEKDLLEAAVHDVELGSADVHARQSERKTPKQAQGSQHFIHDYRALAPREETMEKGDDKGEHSAHDDTVESQLCGGRGFDPFRALYRPNRVHRVLKFSLCIQIRVCA